MSISLTRGILSISIDLEPDVTRLGLAQQRALDETTERVLDLLDELELSATWAVSDPAVSAATERIRVAGQGHEIAIQGDSSWVGRAAGRSRFGRELARRVAHGRSAGMALTTLVLRSVELDEHVDLAIKQGITAVRQGTDQAKGRGETGALPKPLRFGLWSFAVSQLLPGSSRWMPGGGGGRSARLGIDQAIAGRGLYQLTIDAPALAARGRSALSAVRHVLEHADRRRAQGVLDVATLGSTAQQLSRQHRGTPSRSILRVA
jgi:hypothetical protein